MTELERQERDTNRRKMDRAIAKRLAEIKQIGLSTFLAPFLAAAALRGAPAALVTLFF